jgi:hypothetical protein
MYQRALQGYEKAWGPDYTSTLSLILPCHPTPATYKPIKDCWEIKSSQSVTWTVHVYSTPIRLA